MKQNKAFLFSIAIGGILLCQAADDTQQRLAGRALGVTPLGTDLQELCDRIGGRPTGSAACNRAIEWAVGRFESAGADRVELESFTVPQLWLPESAEAECLAPERFVLRVAASPQSASTNGAIESRVVDAGEGTPGDFARLGAGARGAIALVSSREMKTLDDLFAEYMRNGPLVKAAREAGVAALLLESTRPHGLLYRHPIGFANEPFTLPAAIVSREQGSRLARLAAKAEVRVRLRLTNKTGGPYESRNVVAEIRGRERPDEVVVLGAHLDSWDLGTGAEDNGANCAMVIDTARAIHELGLKPRRTIRFVLFTGEEQGMFGSAGYVQRHAAEMDRHIAAVIFDMGSGHTSGFFLSGREDLRPSLDKALAGLAGLGANDNLADGIDGTDNFDFLLSGVPNLVANQDAAPYLPEYHAESDTIDRINMRELKANTALASGLVWWLADNPERFGRRLSRAEVEKLLIDTKLDAQMKAFAQWEDWQAGRRGVSR